MEPVITTEKVGLAARDLGDRKAVGPELFPAECYKQCPALHRVVAALLKSMLEDGRVPGALRQFLAVPLDRAGHDPADCDTK